MYLLVFVFELDFYGGRLFIKYIYNIPWATATLLNGLDSREMDGLKGQMLEMGLHLKLIC